MSELESKLNSVNHKTLLRTMDIDEVRGLSSDDVLLVFVPVRVRRLLLPFHRPRTSTAVQSTVLGQFWWHSDGLLKPSMLRAAGSSYTGRTLE